MVKVGHTLLLEIKSVLFSDNRYKRERTSLVTSLLAETETFGVGDFIWEIAKFSEVTNRDVESSLLLQLREGTHSVYLSLKQLSVMPM